jgi:hypothetical protein
MVDNVHGPENINSEQLVRIKNGKIVTINFVQNRLLTVGTGIELNPR